MQKRKDYIRRFIDRLLPSLCLLCQAKCQGAALLCQGCQYDLPYLQHGCYQCAEPLADNVSATKPGALTHHSSLTDPGIRRCGRCLRQPPAFDHCVAPLLYDFPVNRLIRNLKEQGDARAALCLASVFTHCLERDSSNSPGPELLIPVPLHPRRLRQRGFNQAQAIAASLGRSLHIPLDNRAVTRVRDSPHQQGLGADARRHNLSNAFSVQGCFEGVHLALVDDVITTGSTLNAVAQQFKQAGARQVDAWCLARTPNPRNTPRGGGSMNRSNQT